MVARREIFHFKMSQEKTDQSRIIARTREDNVPVVCWFCDQGVEPVYKEIETLKSFLSSRGKILGKKITGVCSKHQRRLGGAIKNARQLALV